MRMWKEKEFIEYLEGLGIDTLCFMGSGYHIEDVKVGSTFYFSYRYIGRLAKQSRKDALRHVLIGHRPSNGCWEVISDEYKIVSKYRYVPNIIWGGKRREEYITVKNLNTGEVRLMKDEEIDSFFWCFFNEHA